MIASYLPKRLRSAAKRIVQSVPLLRRRLLPSTDYRVLSGAGEARSLQMQSDGWLKTETVARQERAYASLLNAMHHGDVRLDLDIAAQAIASTGLSNPTLLEIGCGSGYYAEVFSTLVPHGVRYHGLDYSSAMIERAKARYPGGVYEVGDATSMIYDDAAFDIVFNGVSLMHILDYKAAIHEAARVAGSHCIFHTLPVLTENQSTIYLQKYAYGSPVVEIVFNQTEFMALCSDAGLTLLRQWECLPYDLSEQTGHHTTTRTFLFSVRHARA
jgi:ubiquinone/menaquinone biosynthesis C-methylase UbiE